MKKFFMKNMLIILGCVLVTVLAISLKLEWEISHNHFKNHSEEVFKQVENVLKTNEEDLKTVREQLSKDCLRAAHIAASTLENNQNLEEDVGKLVELANVLGVEEIHLFDTKGRLYFGTHPEHYNLTFSSSEQMQYFSPMLKNKELEMYQVTTKSTGNGKLMQYAAVWSPEGDKIVQVGKSPLQLQETIENRTLETVFLNLETTEDYDLLAVDPVDQLIISGSNEKFIGKSIRDFGIRMPSAKKSVELSHTVEDGKEFCVATYKSDSVVLVRISKSWGLTHRIMVSTLFVIVAMIAISMMGILISLMFIERYVVKGIASINHDLSEIKKGRLDFVETANETEELETLKQYINDMLMSVKDNFYKLSIALEKSNLPIGIVEFSEKDQHGFATSRVQEILNLESVEEPKRKMQQIHEKIVSIKQKGRLVGNDIYELVGASGVKYVRMEEIRYKTSHLIVLVDVTEEWGQKQSLYRERDIDELTSLYNRRGFHHKMNELMMRKEDVRHGAMLIIDADGLKLINDTYGHGEGDRYLRTIAETINTLPKGHVVPARLGGDEFALFLYGYDETEELEGDIIALQQNNKKFVVWQQSNAIELPVAYSLGCAKYAEESEDYHELLYLADQRMYENKRLRKGKR